MNKVFEDSKSNTAIIIDEDNSIVLSYDYIGDGSYDKGTEGILKKANKELIDGINKFFQIDCSDYGVELVDDEDECDYSELKTL